MDKIKIFYKEKFSGLPYKMAQLITIHSMVCGHHILATKAMYNHWVKLNF